MKFIDLFKTKLKLRKCAICKHKKVCVITIDGIACLSCIRREETKQIIDKMFKD